MNWSLVFHPAVYDEVDEAYRWYEHQRTGLGDDFLAAIEAVYNHLQTTPEVHQLVYKDIRRTLARRFPYVIYYRLHPDRVEVVSVHHSRRDPARWQARV